MTTQLANLTTDYTPQCMYDWLYEAIPINRYFKLCLRTIPQ